mmetsp:Transcript_86991/g.170212  ORF Transcript_86991/g.170212 Transcript_86991/m.170212 type:complete len:400 (+) Transcript_86991:51-1250(+)
MPLLSKAERKTLHTYQYSGGDSSPVYKNVLSPLAQFCVDTFIPMWMAPNVVTLLGLIASSLSLTLTLYFDPELLGKGPRWLYLVTGLCVFAYQTFDNMDGKQARRTGSSSALGMLFDHGCDAINAGLMCIPMGAVMATGWTTKLYMCIFSGFVPFYFQTWEEYYIGSMVLPPFNGPTEGLLMAAGMGVIAFFVGPPFFQEVLFESELVDAVFQPVLRFFGLNWEPSHGFTPYLGALAFTTVVSTAIAIKQVITVFMHVRKTGRSVAKAFLDLLPFLVFFPCLLYYGAISEIALKKYPVLMFLCISASFVEMLVHMMLRHICHGPLEPLRRTGAFLTALLPIVSSMRLQPYSGADIEFVLLSVVTVYSCQRTGVMLYQMCTEVADELGIYVLRLGKSKSK